MDNDISGIAKKLSDALGGSGKRTALDSVLRLLSTESGKRVIATLLSDGGERVKHAAEAVKSGDTSGVEGIISAIAKTPDGEKLISELQKDFEKMQGR